VSSEPGRRDVVVIGGCGHVGLPLGIAFADTGLDVVLYDVNADAVDKVNRAEMPFLENGAPEVLERVVRTGKLTATIEPTAIATCDYVVVVIGTPVDEHLNPDPEAVPRAIRAVADHLRDGQVMILRSTVYPGVTALVERLIDRLGLSIEVTFCPERIAEGRAMVELYTLPQIVGARTETQRARAAELFGRLTDTIVDMTPEEAELAKLFTNTWRYIKFATANQLYMIANSYGLDFERIRSGLAQDYPRAADLARAGFAAGPCLFKDTMQLAAFNNNNFTLGHAAMMVNEGLPLYVVSRIQEQHDLDGMTVGILGMAFKAESDDIRSSLSYKLKRILHFRAKEVLCTDPFVSEDPALVSLEEVLERSDLLVIGAPHAAYRDLDVRQPVVDVWNLRGLGVRI
jgi:UDP-N-acetyl-D-mannosaminuronic acid dehydrogenase